MKLVSVIIPTYNREKTIQKALESVLNQSYHGIEVIVSDDGSTDNTIQIVREMMLKDSRVQLIGDGKNHGACYARNQGIEIAQGEYIAFQDSDDIWKKNKIERCLKHLEEKNVDCVFHQVISMNVKNQIVAPQYDFNNCKDKMLHVLTRGAGNTQTFFAKAYVFKDIHFDERLPRSQDWEIMIRVVEKYNVYFIEEPLVEYYIMDDSISKSSKKGIFALNLIFEKHYKRYLSQYNDELMYSYNYHMGELYSLENNLKDAKKYFKKALQFKKDKSVRLKIILINFHLYKIVRKIVRGN